MARFKKKKKKAFQGSNKVLKIESQTRYHELSDVYSFICLFTYLAFHFLAQIGLDLMMPLPQAHRC